MLESILPEGTFLRENPLLSVVIVAAATATVFLIMAAVLTSLKPRRESSRPSSDPVFMTTGESVGGDTDPAAATPSSPVQAEAAPRDLDARIAPTRTATPESATRPPRKGFGFGALLLAFVFGAGVGFAAVTLIPRSELRAAIYNLANLFDEEPPTDAPDVPTDPEPAEPQKQVTDRLPSLEEPGDPAPESVVAAEPAPAPAADSEAVSERLTSFADGLKGSIPREAGPDMVLTSVETDDMSLQLGYTLLRQMPADTVDEFDAFIMKTAKALFCGDGARELRFLNDNGVSFHMNYTGPQGDPVTALTVPPRFCA